MATSNEELMRALEYAREVGDDEVVKLIEQHLRRDRASKTSAELEYARDVGKPALAGALERRLDRDILGLAGPALTREERERKIELLQQEQDLLAPRVPQEEMGRALAEVGGGPIGVGERIVQRPSGEFARVTDPRVADRLQNVDAALSVGTAQVLKNFFQSKDDEVQVKRALMERLFTMLPESEQERLRSPRARGLKYDDYREMPPLEFFRAIEKGGLVSQHDIRDMLGPDDYNRLLELGGPTDSFYEHVIQPLFSKGEMVPSERFAEAMYEARQRYTEEIRQRVEKPFVSESAELMKPTTWFDETTKAPWEDPAAFTYSLIEQLPNMLPAIIAARTGGRLGASIFTHLGRRLGRKASEIVKLHQRGAVVGGITAGAGVEGILIRDAVYSEVSEGVKQLPQEKWQDNPLYVQLISAGYSDELAKQVIAMETANKAGKVAMVVSGLMMGSPMSAFFGRMGAGRLTRGGALSTIGVGALGEGLQEGAQEFTENLIANWGTSHIDPNQPLFEGGAESFFGGFFLGAPLGALGGIESPQTAGIDRNLRKVIEATNRYTQAANERWEFQNRLEHGDLLDTPPRQRVEDLQKLERLQLAEAQALLDAEPIMRRHMVENNAPPGEIKMLDRLKARAHATLTDIAVAQSRRMTAAQMLEQERRIQQERAELQELVNKNMLRLEDIKDMVDAIESVQRHEAITPDQEERLIKAGYGQRSKTSGRFVILPKGARAVKELRRQQEALQRKIDTGFIFRERDRRDPSMAGRRAEIDRATPEERESLIYTDHLTELPNKRAFDEREFDAKAVAAVDVDSLKWVNDNMGHVAGDKLLQAVADALKRQKGVRVYRRSGDEFAVAADSPEQAEAALQAAAKALENTPIRYGNDEVKPTITWGVAENYDAADAKAAEAKEARERSGKRAKRGDKPSTFRVISQGLLFQQAEPVAVREDALSELQSMEPVAITDELSGMEIPRLRERAARVWRSLMPARTKDGLNVQFVRAGLKKLSRGAISPPLMETFPKLPEMIEKAVPLTRVPTDKAREQARGVQYRSYGVKVNWNGEDLYLKLVVREDPNGAFLHSIQRVATAERSKRDAPIARELNLPTLQRWFQRFSEAQKGRPLRFMMRDDERAPPGRWSQVRHEVERGDEVEIVTPYGTVQGIVTRVRRRPGKDRLYVSVEGRPYVFNPEKNWLIRPEDDADLEWITNQTPEEIDAQLSASGRSLNVIPDVTIGRIGRGGFIIADLDVPISTDPGHAEWYEQWLLDNDHFDDTLPFLPRLEKREATDKEMAIALEVWNEVTSGFRNLPPIKLIRSIDDLRTKAPHILDQMRAQGASERGVRGAFDEENPNNGILIFVQNIAYGTVDEDTFRFHLKETILHELIGHYGIRGVFGDEAQLTKFMEELVDRFPNLAKRYSFLTRTKREQGEEMLAYIAGEMMARGEIPMTPRQKNLLQRIFDWIRDRLRKLGWIKTESEEKRFWNDEAVQRMLARALDLVRDGRSWNFVYRDGRYVRLSPDPARMMRDADIFSSGMLIALDTATKQLSKRERKELEAKYAPKPVPKEVPLFPEEGSPSAFLAAVQNAVSMKLVSKKEVETSFIEDFLKESTYASLLKIISEMPNVAEHERHEVLRQHMPKHLANKDRILVRRIGYINQRLLGYKTTSLQEKAPEDYVRIGREVAERFYKAREKAIEERDALLGQKIDPKRSRMTKELLRQYLKSSFVLRVRVQPWHGYPDFSYNMHWLATRYGFDSDNLTPEQTAFLKREIEEIKRRGVDIGYNEEFKRWIEWVSPGSSYPGWVTSGTLPETYQETFIMQEGGGYEVGSTSHFSGQAGVLMHVRHALANLVRGPGMPDIPKARNPAMEGKALLLIELQSDWLQALRHSYRSLEEQREGERRKAQLITEVETRVNAIVNTLSAHFISLFDQMVDQLQNVESDPEFERFYERKIREQVGMPDDDQVRALMRTRFADERLDAMKGRLDSILAFINDKLEEYRFASTIGAFDARAEMARDQIAFSALLQELQYSIEEVKSSLSYVHHANQINEEWRNATTIVFNNLTARIDYSWRHNQLSWRAIRARNEFTDMITGLYKAAFIDDDVVSAKVADYTPAFGTTRTRVIEFPNREVDKYWFPRMSDLLTKALSDLINRGLARLDDQGHSINVYVTGTDDSELDQLQSAVDEAINRYYLDELPHEVASRLASYQSPQSRTTFDMQDFESWFNEDQVYDPNDEQDYQYFDQHGLWHFGDFERAYAADFIIEDENGDAVETDWDALQEAWEAQKTYLQISTVPAFYRDGESGGDVTVVIKRDRNGRWSVEVDDVLVWSSNTHKPWDSEVAAELHNGLVRWFDEHNSGYDLPPYLEEHTIRPSVDEQSIEDLMPLIEERIGTRESREETLLKIKQETSVADLPVSDPDEVVEELTRLTQKQEGGVRPDSPLSEDKYWRNIALKFLIAHAVRMGVPAIVWQTGDATKSRGGAPFTGETYREIKWALAKVKIRGKDEEVLIINNRTLVPRKFAAPMLGRDVAEFIEEQIRGERPADSKRGGKRQLTRQDFLVSTAADRWIAQNAITGDILGFFESQEQADQAIDKAIDDASKDVSHLEEPSVAGAEITEVVKTGRAYEEDFGGEIRIISGADNYYASSGRPKVPILMGSRMSYDGILLREWSKELKKWGGQIKEHTIDPLDPEKARGEGQRLLRLGEVDKLARERWGEIHVQQLQGQLSGWVVVGDHGPIINRVFDSRLEAEMELRQHIRRNFGEDRLAEKVYYIEITDKMVEEFHRKPVAPFHFDPRKDPLLSGALNKIGQEDKPSLWQRYRQWKETWKDISHQGIFDRFYGIKRAVRLSGQAFPAESDPYIQARLTTSLDSVMRAALEYGHPVWKEGIVQTEGRGLLDILRPVSNDIDSWCLYMAGIRAKRLMLEGYDSLSEEQRKLVDEAAKDLPGETPKDRLLQLLANLDEDVREQSPDEDPMERIAGKLDDSETSNAIRRVINASREHLFDPAEIKAMVGLGEASPVFKRVAEEYAAYNKAVLDFAEQAGVINSETRPLWENADYVPFYRVQDSRIIGPLSPSAGVADQVSPIRRLKGSRAKVGDIMHNIMINLSKLIDSSMKNHAALLAVDSLRESGLIQKEPMTFSQELIELGQVKKLLLDRGLNPEAIPEDALKGFQKMFALQPPEGPGVISVLRNGKKEFYYTDDDLLYRALTAINKKSWGGLMTLLRAPKRLFTTLTTLDPGFMLRNYLRDAGSAFVLSRDKMLPLLSGIKGFHQALLKDDAMKVMMSAGAAFESGYINQYDPNTTRRLIRRAMRKKSFARTVLDTPYKLFEAYLNLGSAVENANRMAVYNAAINAGKSKAQAVYEAKDLMDFSMHGDWPVIQFLVQTVPFMGARLQSLHRLGRGAHENPLAFFVKGSLIGLAGLALWFQYRDDERYKELEDWDKDTFYHFWIGDNHYRLPKPFEVGAIFNTIPERVFEYIYSRENDAGKLLLKRFGFMLAETFSMNPVAQTALPMIESYFNWDFFRGRDIVSPYEERRLPPEQYRYTTSPTMIEIARRLPGQLDTISEKIRSPLHLQHLFEGYTSTLGRYFLMGADALMREMLNYPDPPAKQVADYPVLGSFFRGDAPRRTRYEQEVYDLIRKVTQVQGTVNFLAKTNQLDRMDKITAEMEPYIMIAGPLEDIREQVSQINSAIMQIHLDETMSPEEKRKEIDILQEEKNELFKQGYELRPGSATPRPITQMDIDELLNNFGVDDAATAQIKDARPETASLLESIEAMPTRLLESLVKASGQPATEER